MSVHSLPNSRRSSMLAPHPSTSASGSICTPEDLSQVTISSARALKRGAIVSRGWADLSPFDDEPTARARGEVNQQALFKLFAVVVHHGQGHHHRSCTRRRASSRHPSNVLFGTTGLVASTTRTSGSHTCNRQK